MKFSGSFSSLLVVVLPLVLQAAALPSGFGNGNNHFGGNNNNQNQKGANNGSAGGAASSNNANSANNANNNANNDNDLQSSLTLDPSVIGANIAQNGLNGTGSEAGQVASLTSTDNFINFCVGKTITDGTQITAGSCNPIPMGDIPSNAQMPSCKFANPVNGQNFAENATFDITMNINNLATGNFVNPNTNFLGAPQQLSSTGQIVGHSHVVIQQIASPTDTNPPNPTAFVFFKGLNAAAVNGQLTTTVTGGLSSGTYRLASINTAANHQPVIVPVAQHGSLDDMVIFTVGGQDNAGAAAAGNAGAAAAGSAGAAAAGNTGAAAAGGAKGAAAGGAKGGAAAGNNNNNANNGKNGAGAQQQQQHGKGRRFFSIARQE